MQQFFSAKPGVHHTRSTAESRTVSFSRFDRDPHDRDVEFFSVKSFLLERGMFEIDSPDSVASAPNRLYHSAGDGMTLKKKTLAESRHHGSTALAHSFISDFDFDLFEGHNTSVFEKVPQEHHLVKKPDENPIQHRPAKPHSRPTQPQITNFFCKSQVGEASNPTALGKRPPKVEGLRSLAVPAEPEPISRVPEKTGRRKTLEQYFPKIIRTSKTTGLGPLGTTVMQRVFGFLSYTEMTRLSSTCYFLNQCFRGMWFHHQFLSEMDLSNYSALEIRKIVQKSKHPHSKTVLGSLLPGKNLEMFLRRNKVAFAAAAQQQSKKGVISKFEVGPAKHSVGPFRNTLVADRDITKILDSSHSTLTYCNLVSCMFISSKTFKSVAKLKNLQSLIISNNTNFADEDFEEIATNCKHITELDVSKCRRLTERSAFSICSILTGLRALNISHNRRMLPSVGVAQRLVALPGLAVLDVSHTCLSDPDLLQISESSQSRPEGSPTLLLLHERAARADPKVH